jgi:2-haloacid dehalogenase
LIRDIVFDIGWVFVHLNPRPILDFLAQNAAECRDLESVIARISLDDHECGRMSGEGLLERLQGLTGRPVTAAQVHAKWVDMFELQPDMVDLAQRLSQRYRVYLLSNIGDLHWEHLCREYSVHRIGHGALPSFIAGAMKPDGAIYAEAERRFALEPAATVFIDDREDNIKAARSRGWHGIVHSGYEQTRVALRELGVEAGRL